MLKKYLKSYLYLFSLILILTLILSILNYFYPFKTKTIKLLIPIISILLSTIILGKNMKEKAYLESIKFTSIYIILSLIISLIFKTFTIKIIIYYILFLITGIIGGIIGINLKKKIN